MMLEHKVYVTSTLNNLMETKIYSKKLMESKLIHISAPLKLDGIIISFIFNKVN